MPEGSYYSVPPEDEGFVLNCEIPQGSLPDT
jgi:hypothetical protein